MVASVNEFTRDFIIRDKTAVEAGYINHPSDRGGETNHGITKAVAEKLRGELVRQFRWDGTMRGLTKQAAFWIYKVEYWDRLNLDEIHKRSPLVADKLFDIGINMGTVTAGQFLQQLLNVFNRKQALYADLVVDGRPGNVTLLALDALIKARGTKPTQWNILKGLLALQGARYVQISLGREANEDFTWGWFGRLDHNSEYYHKLLDA